MNRKQRILLALVSWLIAFTFVCLAWHYAGDEVNGTRAERGAERP
jgi:hypothetical protein